MQKKQRYVAFLNYFSENHPIAETELKYTNPYELLVAVILSAQCTDKRINLISPKLFERFPTVHDLAASNAEEIFEYIKSVTFGTNKSKHLAGMAKILANDMGGIVPSDINLLQTLPGVGRKTANVIASVIFNMPAMAVDTHVFRVSARLGLTTNAKTPLATELQLMKFIPKDKVHIAHHWLILHGRYICVARSPKCTICPLTSFCKYFEKLENTNKRSIEKENSEKKI